MCCHNSWILYLSSAFKKATQLPTSELTILFIIKQKIFYLIINIPIEPLFFFLFSSHQHYLILSAAISRHTVDSSLTSGFSFLLGMCALCVRHCACMWFCTCVTLRWKHRGTGSSHPSLPVFRRSHSNSRLLRSVLSPAACNGFLQWVGCVCRERLSLSFGGIEMKYYWLRSLLLQLFQNPLFRFQIPDFTMFIKIFLPTAQLICIACQNREGTQIFLIFFCFHFIENPEGKWKLTRISYQSSLLTQEHCRLIIGWVLWQVGLNQGSKSHYTQMHATGSCWTWTYRNHHLCLLKFWTLRVHTDFCDSFADMNNDNGKTREFDIRFVEIRSNYKS